MYIVLAVLVGIVATALLLRYWHRRRSSDEAKRVLRARQLEIQALLDALGEALRNSSTTLREGESAGYQTLAALDKLNPDGSLDAIVDDTKGFFDEWRAAKSA